MTRVWIGGHDGVEVTGRACRWFSRRHSKSIDINKEVCGTCKGRIVFLGAFHRDGTPISQRAANSYSLFVKENYKEIFSQTKDGAATMKKIGEMWKVQKEQQKL